MKVFSVIFSIIVLIALGGYLIFFAFGEAPADQAYDFLRVLEGKRALMGGVGLAFLILGCSLIVFTLRKFSREPSMAFQNPEGEVRVAFSAIEDFIKRLGGKLTEVREMHPQVLVTREGLEICSRIVLEPNINIPEATSRIQEMIKKYVEDVLGIKDIVSIKVLVVKIAPEEVKKGKKKEEGLVSPLISPGMEMRE
ncbi:alkaline shock response membrane anchor protein AmaP [candidate division NPL-UPA2 bacterium]|nr:alkaline shock response membrane anchor protein AmaP [candidate division NPL-UPA2 bacterium]